MIDDNSLWIDRKLGLSADISNYDVINECRVLESMQNGLFEIYQRVKDLETRRINHDKEQKQKILVLFGEDPWVQENLEAKLLYNYFNWFAVDLVAYCRLAGFTVGKLLGKITDTDIRDEKGKAVKTYVDTYVNQIIEIKDVETYRNKVAAHLGITDPRGKESAAIRYLTLHQNPIFQPMKGRFMTSFLSIEIDNNLESLPSWSLTDVFEALSERYWPSEHLFFANRFMVMNIPADNQI